MGGNAKPKKERRILDVGDKKKKQMGRGRIGGEM